MRIRIQLPKKCGSTTQSLKNASTLKEMNLIRLETELLKQEPLSLAYEARGSAQGGQAMPATAALTILQL
jgi:hypothetical protein